MQWKCELLFLSQFWFIYQCNSGAVEVPTLAPFLPQFWFIYHWTTGAVEVQTLAPSFPSFDSSISATLEQWNCKPSLLPFFFQILLSVWHWCRGRVILPSSLRHFDLFMCPKQVQRTCKLSLLPSPFLTLSSVQYWCSRSAMSVYPSLPLSDCFISATVVQEKCRLSPSFPFALSHCFQAQSQVLHPISLMHPIIKHIFRRDWLQQGFLDLVLQASRSSKASHAWCQTWNSKAAVTNT